MQYFIICRGFILEKEIMHFVANHRYYKFKNTFLFFFPFLVSSIYWYCFSFCALKILDAETTVYFEAISATFITVRVGCSSKYQLNTYKTISFSPLFRGLPCLCCFYWTSHSLHHGIWTITDCLHGMLNHICLCILSTKTKEPRF